MSKHIDRFNKINKEYIEFNKDSKNSKLRIRDISNKLNVSEAELLSLSVNDSVSFLSINDFNQFFTYLLSNIDKVMFLIRSEFVVHEKIINPFQYKIINDSIINKKNNSLLIKFNSEIFKYSFFEIKRHNNRNLKSFQFFDYYGTSVLKIYLKGKKDIEFENLANQYKIEYKYQIQKDFTSDKYIQFKNKYSDKMPPHSDFKLTLRQLLNDIAKKSIPVNIYAFGIECMQCHSDIIKNIVDYGPWLNVMDKNFNIHVLENKISFSKSCIRDDNNCIDFYDINNNLVLSISGKKGQNEFLKQIIDKSNV
tara:strand:- start:162 stop:1085 length:924 start_codon:yes stop_codon:yes gene_type:complete